MAPKSPKAKKAIPTTNVPYRNQPDPAATAAINYGEVQSEEIEALQAIYMEDYADVEVKSAWSKTKDRSFKLIVRAPSDKDSLIELIIRLTATYPKSVPILDIHGLQSFHERTQQRVRNIVEKRPKQLVGEVMISAIADDIQDALEEAVQARQQGTLPSLEEERASADEVATALAAQAEEAEAKRLKDAEDDEKRMLQQMVDLEVSRREKRTMTKSADDEPMRTSEVNNVSFDKHAAIKVGNETVTFSTVSIVSTLSQKREHETFLAQPKSSGVGPSTLVVVKRLRLEKSREEIIDLETILESSQKLKHSNIEALYAYRIDTLGGTKYELVLCTEHAERGTLHALLELSTLHVNRARQFAIQILEGLDYIHRNGVAHGNLDSKSIEIANASSLLLKLVGAGYSSRLKPAHSLPAKWKPDQQDNQSPAVQRKSDIWHLGIITAQMFLGLHILKHYTSPQTMLNKLDLSDSFDDLLRKTFATDARKRPSAFDLLPSEFLRTDDDAIEDSSSDRPGALQNGHYQTPAAAFSSPAKRRSRHNSSNVFEAMSRYATDFTEIGRLGKGGFGEVAKARNKLDGGIYAVKKIKQASQLLDQVISEVMVLNKLNHTYVVRYFGAWIEEDASGAVLEDSTTETETATETITDQGDSEDARLDFGYQSTGGLDFVSSAGHPQIEFGDESDSDDASGDDLFDDHKPHENRNVEFESSEASRDHNLCLRKTRSDLRRAPSTLYIQMEYCERHTLRDLIRKSMTADDAWRYVRQIVEGLAHIHGHGIIHRDLKPDNVFIDVAGSPKIGDFGLATTSQFQLSDKPVTMSGYSAGEMTRSVGTTLYMAPELKSGSHATCTNKVDMYSLGIIFYEMCQPFGTAMERIKALQQIREKDFELPNDFRANGESVAQGKLISCLISHKPSDRPSSAELLRSDLLPLKIEDETIRRALDGLGDPRSPYHQTMMSALFSNNSLNTNRVKNLAWNAASANTTEDGHRLRLRSIAKRTFVEIFRRHGAEESRRLTAFPRSGYYTDPRVFQLVDAYGNLLQLPWDLTLPYARQLAQQSSATRCTFAFGNVYRDSARGGAPEAYEEVDFDITDEGNADDKANNDAEILKLTDEIVCGMPLFASSSHISFHLNHSDVLAAILNHTRVPQIQQAIVKEHLSRLGFNKWTWSKVRAELRKSGLPDTTLDDLQQFNFRDVPEKAIHTLRTLLEGSRLLPKLEAGIRWLQDIVRAVTPFNLQRKLYISPLGSVNAKFYEEGVLFQCILERKSSRVVIAAGGRYDSLIRTFKQADLRSKPQGAVGVSFGLDHLIMYMAKNDEGSSKKNYLKKPAPEEPVLKRCDILVVAVGGNIIRSAGMKVLASLWANDISAELSTGRVPRNEEHNLIVSMRHEGSNIVKVTRPSKSSAETEVTIASLISYVQQELREQEVGRVRAPALLRQASQHDTDRKGNVQVLLASRGSKKSNKFQIVNDAQEQWSRKLDEAKNGPILAVETRDDVLDLIQQTRLSDAETWRKAIHSVSLNDRQYVQQIQDMLASWRKQWAEGDGMREACVFNFRTQHCIYYDLGS